MLCQPFATWYGRPTTCTWYIHGGRREEITSECGFWQGDPLANAEFAVAIVEPTRTRKAEAGAADSKLRQHILSAKFVPLVVTSSLDDARRGLWDSLIGAKHTEQAWQQGAFPQ